MTPVFLHNSDLTTQTTPINSRLDVRQHLTNLAAWYREWEQEDRQLEEMALGLNPDNKQHLQKGQQISTMRRRKRLITVKEPLEIDAQALHDVGYAAIREHMARQFAQLSPQSRKRWLWVLLFVLTPEFRQLTTKINNIRGYQSLGQQRNFLLGGQSGTGKTTMTDWITSKNLQVVEAERNRIPIIKIDAPVSNHTPKPLFQRIILECGLTYHKRDNEEELLQKIALLFLQCGVELLIIDEIEHLKKHDIRRRVLEISNLTQGVPIICASVNPANWIDNDPEIAGRWNDSFRLHPYTGERLSGLLSYLELILPFSQPSHLARFHIRPEKGSTETGLAAYIEEWTGGILRDIVILLVDASQRAIDRQQSHLTLSLLDETWKRIKDDAQRSVDRSLRGTYR